jgi:TRAP-type transport system periplasmic protein
VAAVETEETAVTRHGSIPALVGAALVLGGCTGTADDIGEEAQTSAEPAAEDTAAPLTLRMASPYASLISTPAVEHFADEVDRRSAGALTVEVAFGFDGEQEFFFQPDGEQQVVRAVADGEFDLAWAGTRVFDTFGVSGFAALHAPLLVDSYELQAAILDSDIPERLLTELDDIGVTGLAVLAGGLRKPLGAKGPLLGPDDHDGITFQYYRSDVQAAAVSAVGATPTDVVGSVRDAGLLSGEIDGIEHTLRTWVTRDVELAPYVTANVKPVAGDHDTDHQRGCPRRADRHPGRLAAGRSG